MVICFFMLAYSRMAESFCGYGAETFFLARMTHVTLPPEMYRALKTRAKLEGRTVAGALQRAVRTYLKLATVQDGAEDPEFTQLVARFFKK